MRESKRRRRRERLKKRLAHHWTRMLYTQFAAYAVVLLLWLVPFPNPVKLLAVTFHEMSHAAAALLTGGRVFGFAIDPGGAGVTMGVGGNFFLILIAGYIGSVMWGVLLYYLSVAWRANTALIALEVFVIASSVFGWLNEYTAMFGVGALVLMTFLFFFKDPVKVFFLRLVGSACCLYAPLEVVGDLVRGGGAPRVQGAETASDIAQLSQVLGAPAWLITLFVLAAQVGILVWIVRWTCKNGARRIVSDELAEAKLKKQRLREIQSIGQRP